MTSSISTVLPVYNEAACIDRSLSTVHAFLDEHVDDFEMIIVESGSTDDSAALCDAFAASHDHVHVIHEGARNGFGSALSLGFARASKDLAWAVSLDLPFSLEKLLEAVPILEQHDCILSYRSADDRGLYRRCQSVVYNGLAKLLLGLKVRHINSTFKVYRLPIIQAIDIQSRGWMADPEIVYKLQHMGADIYELAVPLIDRTEGESTIRPLTPFIMFHELLRLTAALRLGWGKPL